MCIRKHPTLLNVTMCVSEIHVRSAYVCQAAQRDLPSDGMPIIVVVFKKLLWEGEQTGLMMENGRGETSSHTCAIH